MGIEEDHYKNYDNSKQAYSKAYELIEKINGPQDPFARKFYAAYIEACGVINRRFIM